MFRAILLGGFATLATLGVAQASTITMETRASASGALANAAAYQSLIDGLMAAPATPGYGSAQLSTFTNASNSAVLGGSNTDIAYRYTIDFALSPSMAGNWAFRFGIDFGRGGAIFLDGTPVDFRNTDMWWNGSYATGSQFLQANATLSAGSHRIVVYGLEGCCDGTQQGQFLAPGATGYTTFARNDGLSIPEPATLAVFGAGLLGLAAARRRHPGNARA